MTVARNKVDHLARLSRERGWTTIPLPRLIDLHAGIEDALAQRIPKDRIAAEDRERIVSMVLDRVCTLVSPHGGNFPAHVLFAKCAYWDREILSAAQTIAEEHALLRTKEILETTLQVFGKLIGGLNEYLAKVEALSKHG